MSATGEEVVSGTMASAVFWMTLKALLTCAVLLCVLIALLVFYQEKLIFYPNALAGYETPDKNPVGLRHPGEHRLDYENVAIKTPDGLLLHAWVIRPHGTPQATIMFFQGNAGNMGFRLASLVELVRTGFSVIAVSYRGYGYSNGVPSERGVTIDAQAAIDHFHKNRYTGIDNKKLFVFGRSIGGAVAIRVAHDNQEKFAGAMMENTFMCMTSMAIQAFPFLRPFPRIVKAVLRANFKSIDLVPEMTKLPMLYISGVEDTLIPPEHSDTLFAKTVSPLKWMLKVAMGTHNDTWQKFPKEYLEAIRAFVDAALKYKADPANVADGDAVRTIYVPQSRLDGLVPETSARATFSWGRTWEKMPQSAVEETLIRNRKTSVA